MAPAEESETYRILPAVQDCDPEKRHTPLYIQAVVEIPIQMAGTVVETSAFAAVNPPDAS